MPLPQHKTKIVATIGPASRDPQTLGHLIQAGLNVARLNFSHGDFDTHSENIRRLREAADRAGQDIAILADLPGPKMRIGQLPAEPVELQPGDPFTLTASPDVSETARVSVTFDRLPHVVHPGNLLYLNDGLIQLEVAEVRPPDVVCRVRIGGELRSRKGLNLPGLQLGISAFTDRDRECLRFALEHGVDAVSQSFVESAADIHSVRETAQRLGHHPFVFAKIERSGALEHMDSILEAADGIMIARGDLGVEVPIEQIAVLQKQLIQKALRAGKPVITATQMLESMTHSRQPTRAEATDVANAILDGTDCVMLSAESAMGRYPVEAVQTLARIAAATESHRSRFSLWEKLKSLPSHTEYSMRDHIAVGIEAMLGLSTPAAVCIPTRSGATARSITRFRLPIWIAAFAPDRSVCRSLQFSYGVLARFQVEEEPDWQECARRWVRAEELAGNMVILVQGPSRRNPTASHQIQLVELLRDSGHKPA